MSDKQKLHNFLIKTHFPQGYQKFEDILMLAGVKIFNKSGVDLSLFVQSTLKRHWNNFLRLIDSDKENNLSPIFKIIDNQSKIFECNNNPLVCFRNKLNNDRIDFLNFIDTINDREYEALCCVVLKNLGANNVFLTAPGNEGGIDFIGTIKFSLNSHFLFGINGPIRIIGQSKFYGQKVTVKDIKEFDSTINDVQRLSPKVNSVLPNWFKQEKGPIIGWFIAHNSFQSGANDRSKNFGFINSNTRDLVEVLTKSKTFYPFENSSERIMKLKKEIKWFLENDEFNR